MGSMPAPTFYTIANARYFPGLVALLNSLRLSGNAGELVVLDLNLSEDQRARLGPHGRLVRPAATRDVHPIVLKPFPRLLKPRGVVCLIDSDMIVVGSLTSILRRAAGGKVCVFADHKSHHGRWFAEWSDMLDLRAPLRRQTYVNSGFLCFSADKHPELLQRWWELCERIPPEQVFSRAEQPFWAGDQDALNAFLASELEPGAVDVLPDTGEAYPDDLLQVEILDVRTLDCRLRGERPLILHYALGPKAWDQKAWLRLRNDAYIRLLPRLLFDDDVPVRLQRQEVPFWLRPGRAARGFVRAIDAIHGVVRGAVHALPESARKRLIALRDSLFRWL
jgi:hypothetical protein